MGNLRSVCRAWEKAGAAVALATDADAVGEADALVFPGQGGMNNLMRELRERGFDTLVREWIAAERPFFGICLGLQALFEYSEENDGPGLGIFPGSVRRFQLERPFKIPHMGWNTATFSSESELTAGLETTGEFFYFVHSYFVETPEDSLVWCHSDYGGQRFVSGIRHGNCLAVQFHPEKSQAKGLQIYRNFVHLLQTHNSHLPLQ